MIEPMRLGRPLFALVTMLTLAPAWAAAPGEDDLEILGRVAGSGEQCLVCRQAIHGAQVVEVRYKGRTFHVKEEMSAELEADPEAYFRDLQSRAALFDEDALEGAMGTDRGHRGWLLFGLYVLAGLGVGAICGGLAVARAQPALPWFFAGLMANVLALGALLARPRGDDSRLPEGIPAGLAKVPLTRAPRSCPHCGHPNHPAARGCAGCAGALDPEIEAESLRLEGSEA